MRWKSGRGLKGEVKEISRLLRKINLVVNMNIFKRKCDSCGKKFGLLEKTYRWISGSGGQLK